MGAHAADKGLAVCKSRRKARRGTYRAETARLPVPDPFGEQGQDPEHWHRGMRLLGVHQCPAHLEFLAS